jgi:hypothetical protein
METRNLSPFLQASLNPSNKLITGSLCFLDTKIKTKYKGVKNYKTKYFSDRIDTKFKFKEF